MASLDNVPGQSLAGTQQPPTSSRTIKLKRKGGSGAAQNGNSSGSHSALRPPQQRGNSSAGAGATPTNMGPPLNGGPMGWGTSFDDEQTDFVLDEMDRLTPRDLAVARFRRNHELLESVFDERPISKMEPSPSPYSALSASVLREQLKLATTTTQEMEKVHKQRLHALKQASNEAALERDLQRAEKRAREDDEQAEPWARAPGEGRSVSRPGYAFVRATTPEPVRRVRQRQSAADEQEASAKPEPFLSTSELQAPQKQQQQNYPSGGTDQPPREQDEVLAEDGDVDMDAEAEEDAEAEDDDDDDDDDEGEEVETGGLTSGDAAPSAEEVQDINQINKKYGMDGAEMHDAVSKANPVVATEGDENVVIVQEGRSIAEDTSAAAVKDSESKATAELPQALATEAEANTHPLSAESQAASKEDGAAPAASTTDEDVKPSIMPAEAS